MSKYKNMVGLLVVFYPDTVDFSPLLYGTYPSPNGLSHFTFYDILLFPKFT